MRIGHRARMAMVNALFAGLILMALFIAAILGFTELELVSAREEIDPALGQAVAEYHQNPAFPDLVEIVSSFPDLSIAVFNLKGQRVLVKGNMKDLPLTLEDGVTDVAGIQAYLAHRPFNQGTVVAGVGWSSRGNAIRRLALFLAVLWAPMVCLFAFVSWRSSKSTFEPLERLSRQAEALSAENLSARLSGETGEYRQFGERLNRFLDRLESSVKREDKFASDAAHELRTPLTVLRGHLETALLNKRTPEQYRETLKQLGLEIERLSGLVELLLQSATLVQGDVPAVDLQEQTERAHARWVDRFADRSIELALESEPCSAKILPREFDIIVDNLLSNALKASPNDSVCGMRVQCQDRRASVEIRDQGPGVPAGQAEAIFERFTRLDEGRNRAEGGFGIGLSVCRRIAEGRGGKVYLKPSPSGADFVVELPAQ